MQSPESSLLKENEADTMEGMERLAARLCPRRAGLDSPTFRADTSLEASWFSWRENVFHPVLQPCLERASALILGGGFRELAALDLELSDSLPETISNRSAAAGQRMRLASHPPLAEKLAAKYYRAAAEGSVPGHYLVFHALRGVMFHLPGRQIENSYLFLEAAPACDGRPERKLEGLMMAAMAAPAAAPCFRVA